MNKRKLFRAVTVNVQMTITVPIFEDYLSKHGPLDFTETSEDAERNFGVQLDNGLAIVWIQIDEALFAELRNGPDVRRHPDTLEPVVIPAGIQQLRGRIIDVGR